MPSFLFPGFLVGALAAGVPLLLHLLKRRPEQRVKFAAVQLLKEAPVEHTARRRLRELLLLSLRVAALVLLTLAFARPFFRSASAAVTSGVTVVALDRSYSMSAPGRFDRARQLATSAIAGAPPGNRVAVVAFADTAEVVVAPTMDRALASAAIGRVTPGFGSTRYRAGLNAAAQTLGGRGGAIVVVTDLQESGWDAGDPAAVPESARIDIADVGPMPPNLAVASVTQSADGIVATIRNVGDRARSAAVHLTLDGRRAGDTTVTVEPNQPAEALFRGARGADAMVAVDDREGIQADNIRYAVLGGRSRPTVQIVTSTGDLDGEAFYVHQALAANTADSRRFDIAGIGTAQLASMPDDRFETAAAMVLLSTRGLEHRGRERVAAYVNRGGGVIVALGQEVDAEVIGDVLGEGSPLRITMPPAEDAGDRVRGLAPVDVRHPIFAAFGGDVASLGLVRFRQVAKVAGPACQPLAQFTTGEPALLDCTAGAGRALVVASDLNNRWNDFPLRATFVPFLQESVRYVSSAMERRTGLLVADVPQGILPQPGIVRMADARGARSVAINVDLRESDPARLSPDEFASAVTRLKDAGAVESRIAAAEREDRQHIWQYALVAAFAALAAEGLIAARTA